MGDRNKVIGKPNNVMQFWKFLKLSTLVCTKNKIKKNVLIMCFFSVINFSSRSDPNIKLHLPNKWLIQSWALLYYQSYYLYFLFARELKKKAFATCLNNTNIISSTFWLLGLPDYWSGYQITFSKIRNNFFFF